jgi:hypothetical protein
MSMQFSRSERPVDAIGEVEWMEGSLLLAFLHRPAGGEGAGGTGDIPGLCVVIRGALMLR